jgi:hypothetical protein
MLLASCRTVGTAKPCHIANIRQSWIQEHTTAILVKTDAVTKARVTGGTSKYQASIGSLAAPSMLRLLQRRE